MFKESKTLLMLIAKATARRVREMISIILPYASVHRKKYFVVDELKVIYIPVSKAANTSIKVALLKAIGVYQESANPYAAHQEKKYSVYTRRKLPSNYKDYFIFTVVRDQEERIKSCYKNKFMDLEKIRRRGFEFDGYLGGYFKLSDSYDDFLRKVAHMPDRIKDEHFVSQYYWICDLHKANPRVYHIDCMDQCVSDISLFTGRKIEVKIENRSGGKAESSLWGSEKELPLSESEKEFVDAGRA